MYRDYKPFMAESVGKCSNCHRDNVDINISFLETAICKYCWENEVTRCNVCGEYYISDYIEFVYDEENDILMCEYCAEDIEE